MIPLYRTDAYLFVHQTLADAVGGDADSQLVTCREQIFAEGGGQPADHGTILWGGQSRPVLELVKQKGNTLLRIEEIAGLKKGEQIECRLDRDRRLRIMRLHTAQHGLAGAIRRIDPDYQSGGMTIDDLAQTCTMKFAAGSTLLSPSELVERAEKILAQAILEKRGVRTETYDSAEAAKAALGALLRPSDPRVALKGRARVVIIDGLDANACGGTHLRNLSEVGAIAVSGVADGGENGSAVTFTLR